MEACRLLLLLITACAVAVTLQSDEYAELCELFKDGTRLRVPGSCSEYINCVDSTAEVYTCVAPTSYDSTAQNCIEAAIGTTAESQDYCRNRCEGIATGKWVADPASCNGFYYCSDGVALYSTCPDGYDFNEELQRCVTASSCVYVSSMCELVPSGTKFRNPDNCNAYYECTNGVLAAKTCRTTNLYFDVEVNDCTDKKYVECGAHPAAANLCSNKTAPAPGFKPDGATCNGFFYCRDFGLVPDLQPIWLSCPEGTFFNSDQQKCTDPTEVLCTYNRCAGRPDMLVQTSTCDCHNYIICENGQEVAEYSCYGEMFFDELLQSCVAYPVYHAACDGTKKC